MVREPVCDLETPFLSPKILKYLGSFIENKVVDFDQLSGPLPEQEKTKNGNLDKRGHFVICKSPREPYKLRSRSLNENKVVECRCNRCQVPCQNRKRFLLGDFGRFWPIQATFEVGGEPL